MSLVVSTVITVPGSSPDVIVEATTAPLVIDVIVPGPQGGPGPQGDPGIETNIGSITVSDTEPIAPQVNDLWIDTSL